MSLPTLTDKWNQKTTKAQHCISVMRVKVLKLKCENINKHIGKVESVGFVIPHYAYTLPLPIMQKQVCGFKKSLV